MKKAFIFDLDGVLINDEKTWEAEKQRLYKELFGERVAAKMGSTLGINWDGIYEHAKNLGAGISKSKYLKVFFEIAPHIYETSPIPVGVNELIMGLKQNGYRLGIVSASPLSWVTTAINRLERANDFELVLSLYERQDLKHKPDPDGYLEAVKLLSATPNSSIALEDSNPGINSAKAAGLFTIGYQGNLVEGYKQTGADAYAISMEDVLELAKNFTH